MAVTHRIQGHAQSRFPSGSVDYVLNRIFVTIEPDGNAGGIMYGRKICHGQVALKIIQRHRNAEDKIWLYGAKTGSVTNVQHSVLTDNMHQILIDPWDGNEKGYKWLANKGYGKPGDPTEMLDFLGAFSVSELYDRYSAHPPEFHI